MENTPSRFTRNLLPSKQNHEPFILQARLACTVPQHGLKIVNIYRYDEHEKKVWYYVPSMKTPGHMTGGGVADFSQIMWLTVKNGGRFYS